METTQQQEKHVRETVRWFVAGGESVANPQVYFPACHTIIFNLTLSTKVTLEKRLVKGRRRYRVRNAQGEKSLWRVGNEQSMLFADAMEAIDAA